jgi:sodium transport system permease protein
VMGKWAAVALMGMAIAAFSAFSFFPAMALIKSEMLAAMFQYGLREALAFTALLAPFAAAISAALMAVAIRSKTFKEAQATATLVILAVNMTPLVSVFDPSGEKPWHLWIPGLGQQTAMLRVLKNDVLTWQHLLIPTLVCGLIAVVCLWLVARTIKTMAVK